MNTNMFRQNPFSTLACLAALLAALLLPAHAQPRDTKAEEKKKQQQVRFICVSALTENQELHVATRDEEGTWEELGTLEVKSAFITGWVPAKPGQLHLAVREGEELKSVAQFNYPSTSRRAMVVLLPDQEKKKYNALVVDPEKIGLAKGSVLVVNFSQQKGFLLLGTSKVTVLPGQRVVAKPALEANGMYRMMVAYEDEAGQAVACYDRYLPGNPDSRDMLFLFPDETIGLEVFSLPIFGELD